MKKAPVSLCLLLAVFLASIICPTASASSSPPFALAEIYLSGEAQIGVIHSGDVVDAGVDELRLSFSHPFDYPTIYPSGTVTMRDSQGNNPGWRLEAYGYIGFKNPGYQPLKPGETYTVRVKGGPNGVRDEKGGTLAEDVVVTFTLAQGSLALTETQVFADGPPITTTERSLVIPRATTEIRFSLNRSVSGAGVPGAVTVRDSQGHDAGWNVQAFSGPGFSVQGMNLAKNETYTMTIKGGSDGMKSLYGATLPQDITLTFRTEAESVKRKAILQSALGKSGVRQSERYQIHAAKGPLTISVPTPEYEYEFSRVVLEDPRAPEILLDERFSVHGKQYVALELPRDGTYTLLITPSLATYFELTGMDLEVAREMPVLKLPEIKPLETRNDPFTMQPQLLNPAEAKSLRITLNQKELVANALKPDGTVDPVVIDPQRMADGIYHLAAVAEGKSSGNQAISERTFVVDREASFADVAAGHWARRCVEVMHHLGILSGRGGGRFEPDQPVTRAEFAKMLALTLQLKPKSTAASRFVDVPDDWAKPHIQALADAGLIQGESLAGMRYYYPNRTISRAEAATIVGRTVGIATMDVSGAPVPFSDAAQLPAWAKPSVVILNDAKWLTGFPDGTFRPASTLNRDQAAKLLANFLGLQ